jgi:hypothetical protein
MDTFPELYRLSFVHLDYGYRCPEWVTRATTSEKKTYTEFIELLQHSSNIGERILELHQALMPPKPGYAVKDCPEELITQMLCLLPCLQFLELCNFHIVFQDIQGALPRELFQVGTLHLNMAPRGYEPLALAPLRLFSQIKNLIIAKAIYPDLRQSSRAEHLFIPNVSPALSLRSLIFVSSDVVFRFLEAFQKMSKHFRQLSNLRLHIYDAPNVFAVSAFLKDHCNTLTHINIDITEQIQDGPPSTSAPRVSFT